MGKAADNKLASTVVLVVDDEVALRRMIVRRLAGAGATVREAADGEQAHAALAIERFDIVIMDVNLGAANGVELARELQAKCPGVPVLFMSAEYRPETLFECERFLSKPFLVSELIVAMETTLKERRA